MFRPEKMSFVNISVLDEHLTQVLDCLAKLGAMHVVDKEELRAGLKPAPTGTEDLKDIDVEPLRKRLAALDSRAEELLTMLAIEEPPFHAFFAEEGMKGGFPAGVSEDKIEIDPFQIAEGIEEALSDIEAAVKPIVQRQTRIQAEILDLEENSRQLSALEAQGVNVEDLRETRFLHLAFGDIPVEYYDRLSSSLTNVSCVLVPREIIAGRQQILAFALTSDREDLSNALEAAYFSKAKIPEKYHGPIGDVLDEIELEIWTKREEMAELRGEVRSLRQHWRSKLLELHATIAANQVVIESVEKFGKTDRSYFLSGWVPHKDVKRLQKELDEIDAPSGILMSAGEPVTARDAEHYNPKVPTKLSTPFFLRPFVGLITNFGVPRYSDIDPTPFASLAFLAMFGIMFADVGHGGILLLLGLLGVVYTSRRGVKFNAPTIRHLSAFLACCGGASVIFGLVFGSVFGKEEIIKPLWFSLENMNSVSVKRMLKFGVLFGVGMISLGVFLNIAQSFRRKDFKEAFCGQWGIFSLVFYWTVVFLLVTGRQFSWDRILIIVLLLLPIMLREPMSRLIRKEQEHGEEEAEGIIESGFQAYEIVLAYLANTLSYIRVAAFNLSHAGLMIATYSLTEELGGGGNFFLSLPSNIMSNAFVILLEGLIVAIQCMRLEYYEFFSKFFVGEGIEYKPLKIGL